MTGGASVDGLTYSYDGQPRPALEDVHLAVQPGEVLAVVGPSGSGKSTLLRLLSGLLTPGAGTIRVDGVDVTRVAPEARPVAMVFQGFALFPHLDVAANIGFGLRARRVAKQVRTARVEEVAVRLGLGDLLRRMPAELSGGERQRVAVARALLRDPVLFCLDEPLSSLDPVLRTSARRELDRLLRADGRCAVYVTHDQHEAMTLGDRVAVLHEGRIEQIGTPQELYTRPVSTFVASFIGSPPMSLVPAGALAVPSPGVTTLGIRAEDVRLSAGDDATVIAVDDLGHERIAEVDLAGQVLSARLPSASEVRRGDRVAVRIAAWTGFDASGRALP